MSKGLDGKSGRGEFSLCDSSSRGQAMVELVSLLFVLLLMCFGMIFIDRILQFDWWAQQEARFLAFEKTWVPAWGGSDPVSELESPGSFYRPRYIDRASVSRSVETAGSLSGLLQGSAPAPTPTPTPEPIPRFRCWDAGPRKICCSNGSCISRGFESPTLGHSQVSLLSNSPLRREWDETSDEWLKRSFASLASYVLPQEANASAFMRNRGLSRAGNLQIRDRSFIPRFEPNEFEESFIEILSDAGFGEELCAVMESVSRQHGFVLPETLSGGPVCSKGQNRGFGVFVARNIDVPSLTKRFERALLRGAAPSSAINSAFRQEVASQFYAYFDRKVAQEASTAPLDIAVNRVSISRDVLSDQDVRKMLSKMRYLGSVVAMTKISFEFGKLVSDDPNSYSYQHQVEFEQSVNSILHADGEELGISGVHVPGNGYWFPLTTLPVPSFWGSAGVALFEGAMSNVFSEDRDLYQSHVEKSNFVSSVQYWDIRKVLQDDPTGKFKVWNPSAGASFFLVTQPWHITRRSSASGAFRGVGDQTDSSSSSSEEGVLRRRVKGFWLFPSDVVALFQPVTDAMPNELDGPIGFLENTSRVAITEVKKLVTDDDPLQKIFHLLHKLRGISHIDISLPEWPAVRPEAYPGSLEMKNDRMATGHDGTRKFKDYVEEQGDD